MVNKTKKKILVVESNKKRKTKLKSEIKKISSQIFFASNHLEALKILNSSNPDIVLLNLSANKLNGFELGKIIKNNYPVKVIVFLNKSDLQNLIRLEQEGFDDVLIYPINNIELEKCLKFLNRK